MIVDIVEALAALQDHTTAQILIPNLAKLTHGVLGDLSKRRLALASDRDHILTELQRKCFRHAEHPFSEDESPQARSQLTWGQSRYR